MSLLDEARAEQPVPYLRGHCKLAAQIVAAGIEEEALELLKAEDVAPILKWRLLARRQIRISDHSFFTKLRDGCSCDWCGANGMGRI